MKYLIKENTTEIDTNSITAICVKKKNIKKTCSAKELSEFIQENDGIIIEKKKSYVFRFYSNNKIRNNSHESQIFLACLHHFVTCFCIEIHPNS